MNKYVKQSFIIAGASNEEAEERAKGYTTTAATSRNSMTCPRCGSSMQIVTLANDKKARYCPNDKVTLPVANG